MPILRLLYHFLIHMLTGTILFVAIGGLAVGLHFLIAWLGDIGLPGELVMVLKAVEYLIFAVDIVLYVLFILREAISLAREIWKNG